PSPRSARPAAAAAAATRSRRGSGRSPAAARRRRGRAAAGPGSAPRRQPVAGVRLGACKLQKGRTRSSRDWLEDEVLILLAGMVAEATITGQYCERGAAEDLRIARRLLQQRRDTPRQIERIERRLIDKTVHLLEDEGHANAIAAIAAELLRKTTISGRAVRHFFNMAVPK
ncbi:MAG: cell division protein FtsH, partial [Novipirellula sp. JB048]